jgi:hypothetical protein
LNLFRISCFEFRISAACRRDTCDAVFRTPEDCDSARFHKGVKPLRPWFSTNRDWQSAIGAPRPCQSCVFAFAQHGSLGIKGNFDQFRLFVFLLMVFRHLHLSRKGLLARIIPSKPCFFNATANRKFWN